jgi:K+/H+ antiporter YhaU regulatory subunit KhtT
MRMTPGTLVGSHPWGAGVRERSGASLVGLERDEKAVVEFPPDFRIEPGDLIFVCGTATSLDAFAREFRAAPWDGSHET